MPGTDFDINAWEAGQNNHAQGEEFDINKYEGSVSPTAAQESPAPQDPRAVFGKAGLQGAKDVITSLPAALNPVPQSTVEKAGIFLGSPAPLTRMVTGVLEGLGGATQIPAAVRDINASPNPGQAYLEAGGRTAGQALTQAAIAKGTGLTAEDPMTAARVSGKVIKGGAKALDVASFDRLGKLVKTAQDTWGEIQDVLKPKEGSGKGSPAGSEKGTTPKTTSQSSAPSQPSQQVITDGAQIKARLAEILKDPQEAALDKLRGQPASKGGEAPVPDAGVLKSRLQGEAEYVRQAAHGAGPDATVKEITAKAQELKGQGDQFEKTFGQPLENYRSADGSFDMPAFLQEVVKPGTEPPAHVISRVFGSDGVKLVQDVSGKPIEKWQSQAPAGEPKGGSARLAAKTSRRVLAPEEVSDIAGRVKTVTNGHLGTEAAEGISNRIGDMTSKPVKFLSHGNESAVFDAGDNHLVKVREGEAPKIDSNLVAKPVKESIVETSIGKKYTVSKEPVLDTKGITAEDVADMRKKLKAEGYYWRDASVENLGRDAKGNLKVLDRGSVDRY